MKQLTISTLVTGAVLLATPALAAPRGGHEFVHSATGPGAGQAAFSVAARAYVLADEARAVALPALELGLVYGLSDAFDLEGRLTAYGPLGLVEAGPRWRIAGDAGLGLALKAQGTALVAIDAASDTSRAAGLFGVTPGAVLSLGGARVQASIGVDVPLLLATGSIAAGEVIETASASTFAVLVRPWVGLEVAVRDDLVLHAQAQAYLDPAVPDAVLPSFALGASW
jgi:hypothetical protein